MKRSNIFFVLMAGIIIFTLNSNGAWYANDPPPPIPPPLTDTGGEEIDDSIIEGSSNILESYSTFFLLINESEISPKNGFDFIKAKYLIDIILKRLETASITYSGIVTRMKQTTFDPTYIFKLKELDYDLLLKTRRFHPVVFGRVRELLSNGDIPGFFDKILTELENIIAKLILIQEDLQQNTIPDIEKLRTLYEQYSDFMLMGYYSSVVFSEIKDH